jgi:hypothetical protein
MTTPEMTCEAFSDKLMDFLEGDVDAATHAALDAHARACAECGALLADVRRVTARAAALPVLEPSRDLWSGIATRIDTPVVALAERRAQRWGRRLAIVGALAATFVIAAVLGSRATRRAPAAPAVVASSVPAHAADTAAAPLAAQPEPQAQQPAPAATPAATRPAAARLASATPSTVEATYDAEILRLRAIVNARRTQLDTATIAVIEKNLKVIDDAIAQCKAALARDPASRYLMESLNQSLDIKVQLLRTAASLPART